MNYKPEIAYLIQNVLPLLTEQFDFPRQEDERALKIDEIPIQMGSGTKKPDIVYYHNGIPVLLLEAKRPDKNLDKTLLQAMSYAKLFPVAKYSKDNIKPKIIIEMRKNAVSSSLLPPKVRMIFLRATSLRYIRFNFKAGL